MSLDLRAAQTLTDMHKAGEERLHDAIVLFARALAIEVAAAAAAGKPLAGTRLTDGRYAVDIHREPVLLYYLPDPDAAALRVTDLIWLAL
ncbi:hypothetical protein [Peterkaempfera sp. SMS 1(5)a]|uniref:hypothetical protein n=1 Tax=Peterkaempfera podocarpi TaxID=3232308 RepID=UPI00366D237E